MFVGRQRGGWGTGDVGGASMVDGAGLGRLRVPSKRVILLVVE